MPDHDPIPTTTLQAEDEPLTPEEIHDYEEDIVSAYSTFSDEGGGVSKINEIMNETEEFFPLTTPEIKAAAKRIFERWIRETDFAKDSVIGMNTAEVGELARLVEQNGGKDLPLREVLKLSAFNREFFDRHGITDSEIDEILKRNKKFLEGYELLDTLQRPKGSGR